MLAAVLGPLLTLVLGTAYPAYASFKAVKSKNAREYVKWMMYWIVFALYKVIEVFADIFIGIWFPLYHELKFFLVLWLVFPGSKVPSFIYRSFIHPNLSRHEEQIDAHLERIWDYFFAAFSQLGSQGANYLLDATVHLVQKGQITVANQLPKILDLTQGDSVIQHSATIPEAPVHEVDRNSGDYEDFDMLTLENEYLVREGYASAQDQQNNLPLSPEDFDPNSEEEIPTEFHHSRLRRRQEKSKKRDTSGETSASRSGKSRQRRPVKK